MRARLPLMVAGLLAVALAVAPASAARLVIHYAVVDGTGVAAPRTCGSSGIGEVRSGLGRFNACVSAPPRPTNWAVFTHPCTGRSVVVPLRLPESTPRMEYRPNRTIYNYGSYTVEVAFLPDGGVDVVYNSGLFRAP